MDVTTNSKGRLFEKVARYHLKQSGFAILSSNQRTRFGEIDILAMEKKTGRVLLAEVRGRADASTLPHRFLGLRKSLRLTRLAAWAARRTRRPVRIELIEITGQPPGWCPSVFVARYPQLFKVAIRRYPMDSVAGL
jgi:Holliday junction resolvase-like predicted endonuclease